MAAGILGLIALGAAATGRFEELERYGGAAALLTERDPRSLILFVVLFAYAVTARRYVLLGAARAFDALRPLLSTETDLAEFRAQTVDRPTHARRRLRRAIGSLAIAPIVAVAIDDDLSIYLLREYWNYERFGQWAAGLALCWNFGLLLDATLDVGRRFDRVARRIDRVDLLRLAALAPFANLGLRTAFVWLLMAAVFALNLVDSGYLSSVLALSLLSIVLGTASVLPPMLGSRARVREAKSDELERVARALQGEPDALRGSVLEARRDTLGVADLLAYRAHVAALSEWPFDTPMLLRLAIYVAIPLGSWIGGAVIERMLESTLG